MDTKIILDEKESISNRDLNLETVLLTKLFREYIDKYVVRMNNMEKDNDFIREDKIHNISAGHHIMYKLKVGPNGETHLTSADGHRGYEFLVEFDLQDPEYGIYYGCRGLILDGDQKEEIDTFLNEWNNMKHEVCFVLNSTFLNIDFTDRFQATNNANNKTFWPFWIALGEDENVLKVAARATKLIAKVYKCFIDGNAISNKTCKAKRINIPTHYTIEAYNEVLEHIKKECGNKVAKEYKSFISKATNKGVLQKDNRFENCWKFPKLKNIEIAFLIRALCSAIGLNEQNKGKLNKDSIPWKYFIPLFLSKNGESLENVKKQYSNSKYDKSHEEVAKEILSNLGISKNHSLQ